MLARPTFWLFSKLASPLARSTFKFLIPGIAPSALVTAITQCWQLIPWILIFSIPDSPLISGTFFPVSPRSFFFRFIPAGIGSLLQPVIETRRGFLPPVPEEN
jgi:hypothetical protein